ncbi:SMI1/KNR4 family protein [Kytococcus sp. Marseille-QA3725]
MTTNSPDPATYLDPEEPVTGCDDAGLSRVAELFGHPLPPDYADVLRRFGGYNADLLRPDGSEVHQFRIHDADAVEEDLDYETVEEYGIAVAGMDAWRWILHQGEDGPVYLNVDIGSGDVVDECHGTFADLLAMVVAEADAFLEGDEAVQDNPPEAPVPSDPLELLDPTAFHPGATVEAIEAAEDRLGCTFPDDLRTVLRHTNGYRHPASPVDPHILVDVALFTLDEMVAQHEQNAVLRETWPEAIVVGCWDENFPYAYDAATGMWFGPHYAEGAARPWVRYGPSMAHFLATVLKR